MSDYFPADDRAPALATADYSLPLQKRSRSRTWLSLGMIATVFFAGGICGAAAMRVTYAPQPLGSLDEIPARVANRMQRQLGLTDAQRDRIEQIGQAHTQELRRIRGQVAPQMRAELRTIIEEIAAVLSPEQAQRWREHAAHRLDTLVPNVDDNKSSQSQP